jgi:hypothetical protein
MRHDTSHVSARQLRSGRARLGGLALTAPTTTAPAS